MSGAVDRVLDRAVARWLDEVGLPGQRVVSVEVLAGGFSNENLLIGTDSGARFVLRRFLRGNSCAVEAALGRRLRGVVPVAGVVAAEPDESVAGQPLLLTEYVPGRLLSTVLDEAVTGGGNGALADGRDGVSAYGRNAALDDSGNEGSAAGGSEALADSENETLADSGYTTLGTGGDAALDDGGSEVLAGSENKSLVDSGNKGLDAGGSEALADGGDESLVADGNGSLVVGGNYGSAEGGGEGAAGGHDGADAGGNWRLGVVVGRVLAAIGRVGFARPGFFSSLDGVHVTPEAGGIPEDLAAFVRSRMAETALLSRAEQEALVGLAERGQRLLDVAGPGTALVHSDFNPKNLLVAQVSGQWRVTAVLDWEFAYSGHPLADVGNMLRFAEDYPADYVTGFIAGLRDGGATLPPGWRETSAAMDLFALADLLTRPAGHPLADKVVRVVRQRLSAGLDHGHRNA